MGKKEWFNSYMSNSFARHAIQDQKFNENYCASVVCGLIVPFRAGKIRMILDHFFQKLFPEISNKHAQWDLTLSSPFFIIEKYMRTEMQ